MDKFRLFLSKIFEPGTPASVIACGLVGVLVAVLFLLIGFWRTLLLTAIVGAAYFIGTLLDEGGRTRVKEFFCGLFQKKE